MRTWPIGWAAGAERAFSPVEVGFFSQGVLVVILLRHWRTISTLRVDDILPEAGRYSGRWPERYPRLSGADVGRSSFGAAAAIEGGGDDTAGVAGAFAAGKEGLEFRVLE